MPPTEQVRPTKKRLCVDIPHPAIFDKIGIEACLTNFADFMGDSVNAVVLPAVLADGSTYTSALLPKHGARQKWFKDTGLDDWLKDVAAFDPKIERWLSCNIMMPFLGVSDMRTCDQFGDVGAGICISNPIARRYLSVIVNEVIDRYNPSGILFVMGSCMPTSNAPGHDIISSSCFCKFCLKKIRSEARSLAPQIPSMFSTSFSPLNLGLKPQPGSGVRSISFDTRWTADRFLAVAESEQLISPTSDKILLELGQEKLRMWAENLLTYTGARAAVNSKALAEIINPLRERKKTRFAVALETPLYNWASAIDLKSLADANSFDEYWVSGMPPDFDPPSGMSLHYYMTGKGRYFTDAYFSLLDRLVDFQYINRSSMLRLLLEYSNKCASDLRGNKGNLQAISFTDTYAGSCAIPAMPEHIQQITELVISSEPVDNSANLAYIERLVAQK